MNKLICKVSTSSNLTKNDIFIAHADADNSIALRLEHELKMIYNNKIKIFNSSNASRIKGGNDWFHYITNEHRNSKLGLIIITKNSIKNLWINFETGGFFLRKDNPAIPLFFDRNDLNELEFPLKGIQGKKLWEKEFRASLISEISSHIGISDYKYDDNRFYENVVAIYSSQSDKGINPELIRIRNEALASMRCSKPDVQFFERKLNEIDLVDNVNDFEKLNILSEIGLEVTLNSFRGTDILISQISWFLRENLVKRTDNSKTLNMISEILWTWGVQAVEYQRNIKSVKIIIASLKNVFKLASEEKAITAMDNCKEALKNMKYKAKQDSLEELYNYLESIQLGQH